MKNKQGGFRNVTGLWARKSKTTGKEFYSGMVKGDDVGTLIAFLNSLQEGSAVGFSVFHQPSDPNSPDKAPLNLVVNEIAAKPFTHEAKVKKASTEFKMFSDM